MTHNVLGGADQIGAVETADIDKCVITVSNDTAYIGGGDEFLLRREGYLTLCDRLIVAHSDYSLVALIPSAPTGKRLMHIWHLASRRSKA